MCSSDSNYKGSLINHFSILLLEQITVDEVVWAIAKDVISKLEFTDCVIYLIDEKNEFLYQTAAYGNKNPIAEEVIDPMKIKLGEGIVGVVAENKKSEIINDCSMDARYIIDDKSRLSEIAVPIVFKNQLIGVIDSEHPKKNYYTTEHLKILTTIASMAALKIEQAKSFNKVFEINERLEQEVKERTKELEITIKKLKKSNKELENYGIIISHDLKSPLQGAFKLCQFAENDINEENIAGLKDILPMMKDKIMKMHNLITGLFEYSRFNKITNTEKVNIKNTIDAVINSFELNDNLVIINNVPQLFIESSPILLKQVFQNLISNAINYSDKDICEVAITVENEDGNYVFKVKDNGPGIESKYYDQIFEMFKKSSNVIKSGQESTGVGLTIAKNIISNLGGEISVNSEVGVSTIFSFSIPRRIKSIHAKLNVTEVTF